LLLDAHEVSTDRSNARLFVDMGRILKFVSGLMMLGLETAVLLAPEYLPRPGVAVGLVLIAILSGVVAWRHERSRLKGVKQR